MKLLRSEKLKLPQVYFISDRSEIKEVPIGIPFIFGDLSVEDGLIRILEYEMLYQAALRSGYPFDFKKILKDNGFEDIRDFNYSCPVYMEYASEKLYDLKDECELPSLSCSDAGVFKKYMKDSAVYVDVLKLKELNVFPIWLNKIEDAIYTNIHNFATYNSNMYNKKLEGMYGGLELVPPNKNLIIIDISSSIPKGVSSTCLALAKNLSETFYADLLITGSKSTLYSYEEINDLNINTIYDENGTDNDQVYFRKLVSDDERLYKTAIVFGDNHSPSQAWSNKFNKMTNIISKEDGKKLCKWKIDKLISFHTSIMKSDAKHIAGYADWFTPREIEHVKDWVKYL